MLLRYKWGTNELQICELENYKLDNKKSLSLYIVRKNDILGGITLQVHTKWYNDIK